MSVFPTLTELDMAFNFADTTLSFYHHWLVLGSRPYSVSPPTDLSDFLCMSFMAMSLPRAQTDVPVCKVFDSGSNLILSHVCTESITYVFSSLFVFASLLKMLIAFLLESTTYISELSWFLATPFGELISPSATSILRLFDDLS